MIIIGAVDNFVRGITSHFFSAIFNLLLAWNMGFGLYQVIWRIWNSRKINKVLFRKLEQFIKESEEKSYEETESALLNQPQIAFLTLSLEHPLKYL
jgi:hypothetical protein